MASGGVNHAVGTYHGAVNHAAAYGSSVGQHAVGVVHGGVNHAVGTYHGAVNHAAAYGSSVGQHAVGVVKGGVNHSLGMAPGAIQHTGAYGSSVTHHAAIVLGNSNPEVQKALKGPGKSENNTITQTLEGAVLGAHQGAAVGYVFGTGLIGAGPPGAAFGAVAGAEGGAVEGFGQGVFDTNKDYFLGRDRTKNVLPPQYRPNTWVRNGYQGALKSAAGAVVGDYGVDQIATEVLGKDAGTAGLFGAAKADWTSIANALRQQASFERQGLPGADAGLGGMNLGRVDHAIAPVTVSANQPVSLRDYPRHASALRDSVSALQRTGHTDPRRPVGTPRPSRPGTTRP
jgi:hypothetical protein